MFAATKNGKKRPKRRGEEKRGEEKGKEKERRRKNQSTKGIKWSSSLALLIYIGFQFVEFLVFFVGAGQRPR